MLCCLQAERAQRDKREAARTADALRADLDAAAAKKKSLEASFDKLDRARERTRTALQAARLSRGGGAGAAPSMREVDPTTQESRESSLAGSLRGELIGRSRSNVTGLDRVMTGEGYRVKLGKSSAGERAQAESKR